MSISNAPQKNAQLWIRLILAGMTFASISAARAELVLEDELSEQPSVRVVQITGGQTASSNSTASADAEVDVRQMSRGELLRRERMRAELRNEDVLSERLEELRLREEGRLTKQLLGAPIEERQVEVVQATAVASTQPVGALAQAQTVTVTDVSTDLDAPWYSKMKVLVAPRGGIPGMLGNQGFNVTPRFTLGAVAGAQITDLVGIEIGYAFNEYGVALGSSNPWVNYIQQVSSGYYNPSFNTYSFKQHVIDANVKVYVLNSSFKLRPFLLAGGGYARSFMNYDQTILNGMRQFFGPAANGLTNDYTVDSFLATVGAGAEFQLGKNVSIGAMFKYHAVLAANENQPLYGAAFGGYGMAPGFGAMASPYGYNMAANVGADPNRNMAGGSLARVGFFTIVGNVNFTF